MKPRISEIEVRIVVLWLVYGLAILVVALLVDQGCLTL
jgi:hypothetical protein